MTVLWGLGIEARSQLSLRPVRKCPGTQVRLTRGVPSVPAPPVPSSVLDGERPKGHLRPPLPVLSPRRGGMWNQAGALRFSEATPSWQGHLGMR